MDMVRPDEKEIWSVLNDMSSEETSSKVAAWFAEDEGQTWLLKNSDRIFQLAEKGKLKTINGIPSDDMLNSIHNEIRRIQKKKKLKNALWKAAVIIIPLVAITLVWSDVSSRLGTNFMSESRTVSESALFGEKKILIFQDGTKIHLNAGAIVKYPENWNLRKREVSLEGEAYFEVNKNRKRPFTVYIYDTSVKVTGTTFNIKAYPDDSTIDIVLMEGAVTFEVSDEKYTLKPSEKLTYVKTDRSVKITRMEHPDNASMWTRNVLFFKDNTLQEVVEMLGRWYDIKFTITDNQLLSRTFTFKTHQMPLRALLDEMEYISDLKFDIKEGYISVSKK